MSEQPEAFRLAALCDTGALINTEWDDVAGELRRLHAEVNEQARLNGMGAERELALMAKVKQLERRIQASTHARQQAQEALYAERDRHAATVKKMQADLEMRTDESVRYRGVLDATVIVIKEMRQEIESLQAGGGVVVNGPLGYINAGHLHEMQQGRLPYAYLYPAKEVGASVPVYVTPQPEPAPVAAAPALSPKSALMAEHRDYINGHIAGMEDGQRMAAPALVPLTPDQVNEVCLGIFLSDHPQGSSSYDQALADALTAALARINGLTVGDGGAK